MGIYIQGNRSKHLLSSSAILMLLVALVSFILLIVFLLVFPSSFIRMEQERITMTYFYARNLRAIGYSSVFAFFLSYSLILILSSIIIAFYALKQRHRTDRAFILILLGSFYLIFSVLSLGLSKNGYFILPILAGALLVLGGLLSSKPSKFKSKHLRKIRDLEIQKDPVNHYDPGLRRR